MPGASLEIHFHDQDEISVVLESTHPGDDERAAEILLFCLYAARQAANLGYRDGVGLSLAAVLLHAGGSPESLLRDGPAGLHVIRHPDRPGRKRFRATLTYTTLEDPASIRFKLSLIGFSVLGRGASFYAPASVLALLYHLIAHREGDAAFVAGLAAATRHLGSMLPHIVAANQVALAADAAAVARGELARQGPAEALDDRRLAAATRRFRLLWKDDAEQTPVVSEALRLAASALAEPDEREAREEGQRLGTLVLGARAGYLWREAEAGDEAAIRDEIESAMVATVRRDADDAANVFAAARQCVVDGVPLGLASPGGPRTGPAFLEAGFRRFVDDVLVREKPALADGRLLRIAFRCGVAIHDVEQFLADDPAYLEELKSRPRHRSFRLTRDQEPATQIRQRPAPPHKSFRLTR